MDPNWNPSKATPVRPQIPQIDIQGYGSMSYSATKVLLRGIAESTFDNFASENGLLVSKLYGFLEACAKSLSELMLQQTLLEQGVFRSNSISSSEDAMYSSMIRSKQLFQKCSHLLY